MHKAIIFDFFEVIHQDPMESWLSQFGHKREGAFAATCEDLDLGNIDYEAYLERLATLNGQSAAEVKEHFYTSATLNAEVVQLISELQKHHRTGLLSNSHSDEIRPILTKHNLPSLFDEIVISAEAGCAKPDPKIFRLMLTKLGVKPSEAIFVDDNPKNVAAADALGITGIRFTDAASLCDNLKELSVKF